MTDEEKRTADRLLSRIETLVGEFPHRDDVYSQLLKGIIEATNGLRSVFGVVRTH